MKNSIIITGAQGSGKTTLARKIASEYANNEIVFIDCLGKKIENERYFFSECTQNTKLIVFEDCELSQNKKVFNAESTSIVVNRKGKESFTIVPKLVFTLQSELKSEQIVELRANFQIFAL